MTTDDLVPLGSQQASQHPRAGKGELQMQTVETPIALFRFPRPALITLVADSWTAGDRQVVEQRRSAWDNGAREWQSGPRVRMPRSRRTYCTPPESSTGVPLQACNRRAEPVASRGNHRSHGAAFRSVLKG